MNFFYGNQRSEKGVLRKLREFYGLYNSPSERNFKRPVIENTVVTLSHENIDLIRGSVVGNPLNFHNNFYSVYPQHGVFYTNIQLCNHVGSMQMTPLIYQVKNLQKR